MVSPGSISAVPDASARTSAKCAAWFGPLDWTTVAAARVSAAIATAAMPLEERWRRTGMTPCGSYCRGTRVGSRCEWARGGTSTARSAQHFAGWSVIRQPSIARGLIEGFHRLYYDAHDSTWTRTLWRGVPALKCPLDLWIYQEILFETKPDLILETGTYGGGSAYYLASICDLLGAGTVMTIDLDPQPGLPEHERITYVTGSSVADDVVDEVRERVRHAER